MITHVFNRSRQAVFLASLALACSAQGATMLVPGSLVDTRGEFSGLWTATEMPLPQPEEGGELVVLSSTFFSGGNWVIQPGDAFNPVNAFRTFYSPGTGLFGNWELSLDEFYIVRDEATRNALGSGVGSGSSSRSSSGTQGNISYEYTYTDTVTLSGGLTHAYSGSFKLTRDVPPEPPEIPEPHEYAMLAGLALVGFAGVRRWRSRFGFRAVARPSK